MSDGKTGAGWVWVLVALGGVGLLVLLTAPLAIYGVRKYIANAKQAEANINLVAWGDALVKCGERDRVLPPSSMPVPASMSQLAGKKYQSVTTDWSEPAHTCGAFSLSSAQYYQYEWEQRSSGEGMLHARADLDGNGTVDSALDLAVTCGGGKCLRGAPITASDSGASSETSSATDMNDVPVLAIVWAMLWTVVTVASAVWLIVMAFQESVGWGLIALFVPCGRLIFLVQHWERAKRPFFWQLGSLGALLAGTGLLVVIHGAIYGHAKPAEVAPAPAVAETARTRRGLPTPPPIPSAGPIPALDGAAVDLSTVMGRARKLANAWQSEAALLDVEATLVDGFVQPQRGGSAKISFGPSPFAAIQTKNGLFVVTYDKSGIASGPVKGTAGKAIAEPMCAPEGLLAQLGDLKGTPYSLRYELDPDQRLAWLVTSPSQPKLVRAFDPQDCSVRASLPARAKH